MTIMINSEKGNVAVITALFMTVFLGIMALVIDTGFLFGEKQKLQHVLDAAATAGALRLCDGDAEQAAKDIIVENLFSGIEANEDGEIIPENYTLEVIRGFYDESDDYENFSVYSDFTGEDDPDFPADQYNNAVLVTLTADEDTMLQDFGYGKNVAVRVASVAYRERIGILSYGTGGNSDIKTSSEWVDDQLLFKNMGRIHANSDIDFIKKVAVTENTTVSAGGKIKKCAGGIEGTEPVYDIRPIDWDYLKEKAVVFTVAQWPDSMGKHECDNRIMTENGNDLRRYRYINSTNDFVFGLRPGDHGGVVYYFSSEGASDSDKLYLGSICGQENFTATNFVIASELHFTFFNGNNFSNIAIGGDNEKTVYIYCQKDIGDGSETTVLRSKVYNGVVFHTEKNFNARVVHVNYGDSGMYQSRYNILAKGTIDLVANNMPVTSAYYEIDGSFGPPCGAALIKSGRLIFME